MKIFGLNKNKERQENKTSLRSAARNLDPKNNFNTNKRNNLRQKIFTSHNHLGGVKKVFSTKNKPAKKEGLLQKSVFQKGKVLKVFNGVGGMSEGGNGKVNSQNAENNVNKQTLKEPVLKEKSTSQTIKNLNQKLDNLKNIDLKKTKENLELYFEFLKLKLTSRSFWQDSYKKLFKYLSIILSVWIIYLSVFDYFFYIKNYEVTVSEGSFISRTQSEMVIDKIGERKLFGLIPLNNYWFTNDLALKQVIEDTPELSSIKNISLKEKRWPNTLVLNLESKDILATLALKVEGEVKYVVFDKNGEFLGFDEENLRLNLINVNSPVIYEGLKIEEGLNLHERPKQLEKLWFINSLKEWFNELGLNYSQISISSLSDYDNDVLVDTINGTKLLFDYTMFNPENQKSRLVATLKDPQLNNDLKVGAVSYVDFRIDKRVFWCLNSAPCSISKNS